MLCLWGPQQASLERARILSVGILVRDSSNSGDRMLGRELNVNSTSGDGISGGDGMLGGSDVSTSCDGMLGWWYIYRRMTRPSFLKLIGRNVDSVTRGWILDHSWIGGSLRWSFWCRWSCGESGLLRAVCCIGRIHVSQNFKNARTQMWLTKEFYTQSGRLQ